MRESVTLVAEQRDRIAAAAHLWRFRDEDHVDEGYRNAGEFRWFVFWPLAPAGNPYWTDGTEAAGLLMTTCLAQLDAWGVTHQFADGQLPVPGVYGLPEQWPHVQGLYQRAGFRQDGQTETVHCIHIDGLPTDVEPPAADARARRSVGINGTRWSAVVEGQVVGYLEIEILGSGERLSRGGGWADIGNLEIDNAYPYEATARWLLDHARVWLRLAAVDRLLAYAIVAGRPDIDNAQWLEFMQNVGFAELARTTRGWTRERASTRRRRGTVRL